MKREDFDRLPPGMQNRVLGRVVFDGEVLSEIDVGKKPFAPRYDMRIYRQGGYQWASETSAEGIRFWLERSRKSAANGGEWAEKDAKRAKDLERWLAWREWEPTAPWTGERDRHPCTAAPPADKPAIHANEPRRPNGQAPAADSSASDADDDCPI